MADRSWKAFERRAARDLGTERIPAASVFGRVQLDAPDFTTPVCAVQAKLGYSMPGYLRQWLDGITRTAGGRIPLVLWKAKRQKDTDAVVLLAWGDWVRIHSELLAARAALSGIGAGTAGSDTSSAPSHTPSGAPA